MARGKNKVQKINNPDAAGLGIPEVAAQIEVTGSRNEKESRKGGGRK
ncbi:hypothetical protein ACFOU2_19180 [Bacillus songklensis]|uniref:YuzL-like protein n=1 Tax=Bacillus songklensis TaxID=1069116 RepID=A0ABV8B8I6_9BACI